MSDDGGMSCDEEGLGVVLNYDGESFMESSSGEDGESEDEAVVVEEHKNDGTLTPFHSACTSPHDVRAVLLTRAAQIGINAALIEIETNSCPIHADGRALNGSDAAVREVVQQVKEMFVVENPYI